MTAEQLRRALNELDRVWRPGAPDGWDRRDPSSPSSLIGPADSGKLEELETLLGRAAPEPLRILLETVNGSLHNPISPLRADRLLDAEEICLHLEGSNRASVPVIELGVDRVTGLSPTLHLAVDDAWGPLLRMTILEDGSEGVLRDGRSLTEWVEQITEEVRSYVPPPMRHFAPGHDWRQITSIAETSDLARAGVGHAFAIFDPDAKRFRRALWLYLQTEPGVWVEGSASQDNRDFSSLCISACRSITDACWRARSEWVLAPTEVESRLHRAIGRGKDVRVGSCVPVEG